MKKFRFSKKLEEELVSERSLLKQFMISTIIAVLGFAFTFGIFHFTNIYFSSLILTIIILINIYSGFIISFSFAIGLSLIADYFFIQEVGSVFNSAKGFEHFFIITGIACFVSYLMAKFRKAFLHATQNKIEADESRMMMEKILALVSHDVRNPLTTSKMCIQMVLKSPEQVDKNLGLLKKTLSSIEFADTMIQSLLDASRIQSGKKIPLNFEECDLNEHVSLIVSDMKTILCSRLEYISEIESALGNWSVNGIRRTLENLVTNAIKYGDKTTPITVKLHKKDAFIFLEVHNYGKEISHNDQVKLFELYQRTEEVEKGLIRGWGLGLSLVKEVAEAHNGIVYIDSTAGKGTSFILKLPSRT